LQSSRKRKIMKEKAAINILKREKEKGNKRVKG
jgi:hypothetical protein